MERRNRRATGHMSGIAVAVFNGSMSAVRLLIALTFVLAFLAGRDTTTVSRTDEPTVEVRGRTAEAYTDTDAHIDIYGNRIDYAVSDFRVDLRGDLYERHAPDTAVLKLGPPST